MSDSENLGPGFIKINTYLFHCIFPNNFVFYVYLYIYSRFYIDNTPIREVVRSEAMGGAFPSKPMSLYATIWDGSSWATLGGRYKVNYKYSPFVAEFADLVLHGCPVNPLDHSLACEGPESARFNSAMISADQRAAMEAFRRNQMSYSYCHDRERYPSPLPDCSLDEESAHFFGRDGLKFGDRRHRGRRNRKQRSPASRSDASI